MDTRLYTVVKTPLDRTTRHILLSCRLKQTSSTWTKATISTAHRTIRSPLDERRAGTWRFICLGSCSHCHVPTRYSIKLNINGRLDFTRSRQREARRPFAAAMPRSQPCCVIRSMAVTSQCCRQRYTQCRAVDCRLERGSWSGERDVPRSDGSSWHCHVLAGEGLHEIRPSVLFLSGR